MDKTQKLRIGANLDYIDKNILVDGTVIENMYIYLGHQSHQSKN